MATNNKTLTIIASKLGLGDEEKVLSKAAEYERRLQMKSTASSNISDTSKVVICLDLAATYLGAEFDVKGAVKYSGLKRSAYTNSKKVLENLLELNGDKLTTAMLCAALKCSGVQDDADMILRAYQLISTMEIDLNLPQYVCMAVYQACRINKVKVPKSKVIEKSRLKPAQWSKLDAEWTKFADDNFAAAVKKRMRLAMDKDDTAEKMDIDCPIKKEDLPSEPQIELYEDWKRRILENARKALKELENNKHKQIDTHKIIQTQDKQRQSPRKQINDPHKHAHSSNKHIIESQGKYRQSPRKQIDNPHKDTQSPNKQAEYQGKLKQSPRKQIDNPIKHTHSPDKQFQNQNKFNMSTNKYKELKNKYVQSPNKQPDHQDKHIQNMEILENKHNLSPRRSPRKTPQKYDPYKSPIQTKGVRLLFPLDK